MTTLLFVRHAIAEDRHRWVGDDDDARPLTDRGRRQAAAIAPVLAPFAPVRILSSPAVRCVDTVRPLADAVGVPVEEVDELREGARTAALRFVSDDADGVLLLCSHGDVLPELLTSIASHVEPVGFDPPFAKGATWVVERSVDGKATGARYLPPPT